MAQNIRVGVLGLCLMGLVVGAGPPTTADATSTLDEFRQLHPNALSLPERPVVALDTPGEIVGVAPMEIPRASTVKAALVRVRRDGASVRVIDAASGAWVEVSHPAGPRGPAELTGPFVLHPPMDPSGPSLVRRLEVEGVEEFVLFPRRGISREARWQLTFGAAVAGLRLVERTLELVDLHGTPRLRMPAPWIEDAHGARHPVSVRVEGCQVDTSPAAPWGRSPTPTGAPACALLLAWPEVAHPAILDPAWTTTGSMTTARADHSAVLLDDGHVLVVGGASGGVGSIGNRSAELFDPGTSTFAVTASLAENRHTKRVAKTGVGTVLVAGAHATSVTPDPDRTTAEIYDPVAGTWATTGPLATPRASGFSITTLVSGDVLLAGGYTDTQYTADAEVYDVASSTFAATGALANARHGHDAVLLPSGEVMVLFGQNAIQLATERFDPAAGTWAAGADTLSWREEHGVVTLTDERVLVAGGCNGCYLNTDTLNYVFDPATDQWSALPPLPEEDDVEHVAVVALPEGRALTTGGYHFGTEQYAAIFSNDAFQVASPMGASRSRHTATLLASGVVLVAGGQSGTSSTNSAELFEVQDDGEACVGTLDCVSGSCIDGVCCDEPCSSPCQACSASAKGEGVDGVCGLRAEGATCGALICEGPTLTLPGACDAGQCVQPEPESCAPYLCQLDACGTVCIVPADCAPGYTCNDNACKGDEGTSCTNDDDCAANSCVDGVCCALPCTENCESDDDCPAGEDCVFGTCVPPGGSSPQDGDADGDADGGCGCRTARRGLDTDAAGWATLLIAAWLVRRRKSWRRTVAKPIEPSASADYPRTAVPRTGCLRPAPRREANPL